MFSAVIQMLSYTTNIVWYIKKKIVKCCSDKQMATMAIKIIANNNMKCLNFFRNVNFLPPFGNL